MSTPRKPKIKEIPHLELSSSELTFCVHSVSGDFKKLTMQALYGNLPKCDVCGNPVKLGWVDA